jgi:hypothetical protein
MTSSVSYVPKDEGESWPAALDALVAAPGQHTLLFENEHVRVLQTHIPPGHTAPVHTHRWPCVLFVRAWSDFIRRDPDGTITLDTRQLPDKPTLNVPTWQQPLPPHSLENIGSTEFLAVHVEIKEAG